MRSTHESTADFQLSICLGFVDWVKDSASRLWVLTMEITRESSEGFENGCFSSGRWSLIRERSKRGLSEKSYMLPKKSKAAIGTSKVETKVCYCCFCSSSLVQCSAFTFHSATIIAILALVKREFLERERNCVCWWKWP